MLFTLTHTGYAYIGSLDTYPLPPICEFNIVRGRFQWFGTVFILVCPD